MNLNLSNLNLNNLKKMCMNVDSNCTLVTEDEQDFKLKNQSQNQLLVWQILQNGKWNQLVVNVANIS